MGFKKCTGILLALLLLASNTGLAFSVHYCGGEIASVRPILLSFADASCCGMKKPESMGCCKTKIVKSEKEHDVVVKTFGFLAEAPFVPFEIAFIPTIEPPVFIEKPVATYYCRAKAPPLFKLYNQYVFYA